MVMSKIFIKIIGAILLLACFHSTKQMQEVLSFVAIFGFLAVCIVLIARCIVDSRPPEWYGENVARSVLHSQKKPSHSQIKCPTRNSKSSSGTLTKKWQKRSRGRRNSLEGNVIQTCKHGLNICQNPPNKNEKQEAIKWKPWTKRN